MRLFRKRRQADEVLTQDLGATIEIAARKEATKETADKAKAVNAAVLEQLQQNGFHLKIYLAAGGQVRQKKGST